MAKLPPNIAPYISPPEEPLHSFTQASSPAKATPAAKIERAATSPSKSLLSPESPLLSTFELANKFRNWSSEFSNGRPMITNPDPILYPERRQSADYNPPLFNEESHSAGKLQSPPAFLERHNFSSPVTTKTPSLVATAATPPSSVINGTLSEKDALIEDHCNRIGVLHVQSKSKVTKWSSPKTISIPTKQDYGLVYDIALRSKVLQDYNSSPKAYLKRQLRENDEDFYAHKRSRPSNARGVVLKAKPDAESTIVVQAPRPRKAIKKQVDRSGTPEVKHRRTAVKKTKAQYHYNDVPDYCPSLDTIPTHKTFHVEWTGGSLDTSEDPEADRILLHPGEQLMASKLRFHCDHYLATKRRIFVARVNSLIKHPNKQFGKTDAQQVGGVDVNKLSQLWAAYNSVGWFDPAHFKDDVAAVRRAEQVYDPKNTKWVDRREYFGF